MCDSLEMEDPQLIELVTRIAQQVLQPLASSGTDASRIAALKAALDEHAEEGTFGPWGVLARDQLKALKIEVSFDARTRSFVANSAAIAAQIYKVGAFD